jgi:hypothetical protein
MQYHRQSAFIPSSGTTTPIDPTFDFLQQTCFIVAVIFALRFFRICGHKILVRRLHKPEQKVILLISVRAIVLADLFMFDMLNVCFVVKSP